MLDAIGPEIAALAGPAASVIEFGCGSADKIKKLLAALGAPTDYVAIDISRDHLLRSVDEIAIDFAEVNVSAVCADFLQPFPLPEAFCMGAGRRLAFFPGSTIGNQTPDEALDFLKLVRSIVARAGASKRGALLIGVDLKKDEDILNAAYNDAAGVTAAFNRNLLVRANRELGCNFEIDGFRHYAFYHPGRQRIEMHLVSAESQRISLDGRSFRFAPGESIHTESSQKYTVGGFRALAAACGFQPRATWCDADELFSIHWLEATCPAP